MDKPQAFLPSLTRNLAYQNYGYVRVTDKLILNIFGTGNILFLLTDNKCYRTDVVVQF